MKQSIEEFYEDFVKVPGQIGERTARILYDVQTAVTETAGEYAYVEVGSFRGRSLQPHVSNTACTYALSIDPRPKFTADERGYVRGYQKVTTEEMLGNLRKVCPASEMDKIETIEGTSADISTRKSRRKFDLAFIDGEHTVRAAFGDFLNLLPFMKTNSIVLFDDITVVFPALESVGAYLDHAGLDHRVIYTNCNTGLVLFGDYMEVPRLIKPRLCDTADQARARYHELLAANDKTLLNVR